MSNFTIPTKVVTGVNTRWSYANWSYVKKKYNLRMPFFTICSYIQVAL